MKRSIILGLVVAAVVALAGTGFYMNSREENTNTVSSSTPVDVMEKKDGETAEIMEKTEADAAMEKTEDTAMEKTNEAVMAKASSYVTLADYNKNTSVYSSQKKVYFFHASWCPICQGIDSDISSDPSQIPSGTTFIKTDYDSNTALRQKYGVTYQYTFVQVDNDGNEVKQWSATNLDKAIAGIQ